MRVAWTTWLLGRRIRKRSRVSSGRSRRTCARFGPLVAPPTRQHVVRAARDRRARPEESQLRAAWTTTPRTPVRRRSKPWWKSVSRVWSRPIRCGTVACRSATWHRASTAPKPSSSVAPRAWPPSPPAPAGHVVKPCGSWSRPGLPTPSPVGVRPNSPPRSGGSRPRGRSDSGRPSARRSADRSRRRGARGWRCGRRGRPGCLRGGRRRSRAART